MKHLSHKIRGIDILYEDNDIIVVNKEHGILTEETRKGELFTAENALNNYVRKGQARSSKRVWLVHRLDRDTSGLLIFAKSEFVRESLQAVWHEKVEKIYIAAVWGTPPAKSGTLTGYLYEDKNLFVRQLSSPDERFLTKFAQTDYEVIADDHGMTLVKVRLHTGRRNQIRVQFADIGCPLVGDSKYGPHAKPFRERMCLHAYSLTFPHPVTGKQLSFTTDIPQVFIKLFPKAAL